MKIIYILPAYFLSSIFTSVLFMQIYSNMGSMSETVTATAQPETLALKPVDHARFPPPEQYHTIDGLLRSHAADTDDKGLICYPAKGVADFEEHTAKDLNRFTNAAVARYVELGLEPAVSLTILIRYWT